jgi:hypothetical protein
MDQNYENIMLPVVFLKPFPASYYPPIAIGEEGCCKAIPLPAMPYILVS